MKTNGGHKLSWPKFAQKFGPVENPLVCVPVVDREHVRPFAIPLVANVDVFVHVKRMVSVCPSRLIPDIFWNVSPLQLASSGGSQFSAHRVQPAFFLPSMVSPARVLRHPKAEVSLASMAGLGLPSSDSNAATLSGGSFSTPRIHLGIVQVPLDTRWKKFESINDFMFR